MRILGMILILPLLASPALAQQGQIKISSPAEGAKVGVHEQVRIVYEVAGPRSDHIHLYVDGKETAILRETKGSYTLESLAPGTRNICIKAVNKAHVLTGVEHCINVKVG